MRETMGELLATGQLDLMRRLEYALSREPDETTRKQALIAALAVLLGEPAPRVPGWLEAARRAGKDGD